MMAIEDLNNSTEAANSPRKMPTWRDGVICIMPINPKGYYGTDDGTGDDGPSAGDVDDPVFGGGDGGNGGPSAGDVDNPVFGGGDGGNGGPSAGDVDDPVFGNGDGGNGGPSAGDVDDPVFGNGDGGNGGPSAGDVDSPVFVANKTGSDGPSAGDIDNPGFSNGDDGYICIYPPPKRFFIDDEDVLLIDDRHSVGDNLDSRFIDGNYIGGPSANDVGSPTLSNGNGPSANDVGSPTLSDGNGPSVGDALNPGFDNGSEYQNFIDNESHLNDNAVVTNEVVDDTPSEEDIVAANEYQNFIDHERQLPNVPGEADLLTGTTTGNDNTSKLKDIVDGVRDNRYNDFIEHEKSLIDKYTQRGVSVVASKSKDSEKLVRNANATVFEFKINKGKGGGADKIYKSTNKDAIVFSVDNEKAARKLVNKISTLTKSGDNLVVSYNSYKSGKKTVTDKVTLVNYFKRSASKSLKDVAVINKKGNLIDELNLQEQVLKFSSKNKTSDTIFNDKITGSKKKDIYTFKKGGDDVVTDKKGKDTYNVYLNKVDNLVINDKSGKDTLVLKDMNKSDVIFGLDVVRKEVNGDVVYTLGRDLLVMSVKDDAGLVQVNNFFKSFKDTNKDGVVDGFKYGSGRIEKIKYADGSGYKFNVNNINEIKSNVAAWLDNHSDYTSANDVFANGSKEDIQSLIAAYSGNNQA